MPTKELDRGKLFFGNNEIGFQPLGELSQIELDKSDKSSGDVPFFDVGGEYEFTAEIQPPDRMTIGYVMLAIYGFDVEKLKRNNWRKTHGMIMYRRCGKRKSSKNGKTVRLRRNSGKKIYD